MAERNVVEEISRTMTKQGYNVSVTPTTDKSRPELFAEAKSSLIAVDTLRTPSTIKPDVAASTFRLSKIKDRLDRAGLRVELEQLFVVLFDPDAKTLAELEEIRHDLAIARRRVIIAGRVGERDFETRLANGLSRLSLLATQARMLEVLPPLERLISEMKDSRAQELVVAYRDGGLSGLRKKVATLSGEAN